MQRYGHLQLSFSFRNFLTECTPFGPLRTVIIPVAGESLPDQYNRPTCTEAIRSILRVRRARRRERDGNGFAATSDGKTVRQIVPPNGYLEAEGEI
jgi:hypothetical protein